MGGTYATLIGLPYVNLLQLVGVPQDWFFSDISVTCILTTPAGTEVARYSYKRKASDAVTIYEMPYGNYMWYESLFRDEFSKMMASFYADMEQDSDRIRTAVRR
jgi:hypothetical protein